MVIFPRSISVTRVPQVQPINTWYKCETNGRILCQVYFVIWFLCQKFKIWEIGAAWTAAKLAYSYSKYNPTVTHSISMLSMTVIHKKPWFTQLSLHQSITRSVNLGQRKGGVIMHMNVWTPCKVNPINPF